MTPARTMRGRAAARVLSTRCPSRSVTRCRSGDAMLSLPVRDESGPWHLRDGRMALIPGDSGHGISPAPLDSLPGWRRPTIRSIWTDPFAPRDALPGHALRPRCATPATATRCGAGAIASRRSLGESNQHPRDGAYRANAWKCVIRTVPMVHSRGVRWWRTKLGALCLFMPPVEAHQGLSCPVGRSWETARLSFVSSSGYCPDPRLQVLVTDPASSRINVTHRRKWTEQ